MRVPDEDREEGEKRVAPLELFFDLVFVFALTQVTQLMSDKPTWAGLGEGLLVLAALWWAWGAYAWLTNYIAADEDLERLLMFAVMGALLIAALAVPQAFGEDALLFGVAYAAVRWLHIFIFAEANEDVDTGEAIVRLARTALPAPLLLIAAGLVDDGSARAALWVAALAIDFGGPFVFGVRGFRVSAGHFAERFSLIVIIALGESIVAIGAGIEGDLDAGILVASALGLVVACALWWAYFDVVALVSESRFRQAAEDDRLRMARDSYSYLHLPIVAGIVLVALGVKKTLAHVDEPLATVPCVALFGGVALYYAGHLGFRLRNTRTLNRPRLDGAACLPGADPRRDRGRRPGGGRPGSRRHVRGDRLRDAALQRGAAADPPRARRHLSFTISSRVLGPACLRCGHGELDRQAQWPPARLRRALRPARTGRSQRRDGDHPAAGSDAHVAGRLREPARPGPRRARQRRGHPRHLPPPALAAGGPARARRRARARLGPRRRDRLRRGGGRLPRPVPRGRADGPGDRADGDACRRGQRGRGGARLARRAERLRCLGCSRSSGSSTRATGSCARGSPRSSRAASTRWS